MSLCTLYVVTIKKCDIIFLLIDTRGRSRAAATSKTERFVIVNGWKPVTIITKCSILDIAAALDPPLDTVISEITHFFFFFFYLGFLSRTLTTHRTAREGRGETIFYSTLPLPPAHEHSDIYLQLCMWDDYHIFLIAPLVFTRLLLDEI